MEYESNTIKDFPYQGYILIDEYKLDFSFNPQTPKRILINIDLNHVPMHSVQVKFWNSIVLHQPYVYSLKPCSYPSEDSKELHFHIIGYLTSSGSVNFRLVINDI